MWAMQLLELETVCPWMVTQWELEKVCLLVTLMVTMYLESLSEIQKKRRGKVKVKRIKNCEHIITCNIA